MMLVGSGFDCLYGRVAVAFQAALVVDLASGKPEIA
jgi:hypothetical protein